MNVKIDTKEKFTVITPMESELSVIMAEKMAEQLNVFLDKGVPHIVLNLKNLIEIESGAAELLANLQSRFYEKGHSFVICEMKDDVAQIFEKEELADMMNITPTESEAWDIVQMEEIERDLLKNFDDSEA